MPREVQTAKLPMLIAVINEKCELTVSKRPAAFYEFTIFADDPDDDEGALPP